MMMCKPGTGLCTNFAAQRNIAWSDPYFECLKVRRPSLDVAPVAVCPRNIRFTIRDKKEGVGKEQAQCAIEGIDRRKELGCLVI